MNKILCFGDSNTFGTKPTKEKSGERHSFEKIWTSILQSKLGPNYYIIQEGLPGRTFGSKVTFDSIDFAPNLLNGLDYFYPCFISHQPDIVCIMLGTNDIKYEKNSIENVKLYLIKYLEFIKKFSNHTKVILIKPLYIIEEIAGVEYKGTSDNIIKIHKIIDSMPAIFEGLKIQVLDLNPNITSSKIDGIHLEEKSHRLLASKIFKIVFQW